MLEDPGLLDIEPGDGPSDLAILRATFNAVPRSIAVVSVDGRVLLVNDAWRRFARESRLPWLSAGLGAPFLELIQPLCRSNPLRLEALARGLAEVRDGRLPRFDIELPLRMDGSDHWSGLTVTRFAGEPVLLVITRRDASGDRLNGQVAEVLQALSRRLGPGCTLNEAAPALLRATCHLLEWSAAELYLGSAAGGTASRVAGCYPAGPDEAGWKALAGLVRERTSILDQALAEGILCCEGDLDERLAGVLPPGAAALDLRGAVALPLLHQHRTRGAILFLHRCTEPPGEDARLLLATVAARLGRMLPG